LTRRLDVLPRDVRVEAHTLPRRRAAPPPDVHADLAALDLLLDRVPEDRFEQRPTGWKTKRAIQKAVVDGAYLDRNEVAVQLGVRLAESRHASRHSSSQRVYRKGNNKYNKAAAKCAKLCTPTG